MKGSAQARTRVSPNVLGGSGGDGMGWDGIEWRGVRWDGIAWRGYQKRKGEQSGCSLALQSLGIWEGRNSPGDGCRIHSSALFPPFHLCFIHYWQRKGRDLPGAPWGRWERTRLLHSTQPLHSMGMSVFAGFRPHNHCSNLQNQL